ncbi:hypothetical protein GCM10007897_04590 [Sphingobium jiangsuense]|uniref:3-phenylpropionate/cinnamic acid dioxygenase small subunit n=2 Tax=Sphingobium TaxID=165695 RepID=A0A7W6BMK8_9SPHN|nr:MULTISPECIES: 3-phenylpropionate/cinnamic acid dioxygenase subunit beta [Sphingobium]QEH81008.1 3-phenylpropionate/cinnamic acid dioxygenase subunit beta [Sphingomonas sp. C8-2]SCW95533.1 biphenyl 2,3-dioxygenase beta subunit [Sphingobium faniae]AHZ46794.1 PbaA2 [Sphingobium wenxiniae]MBB3926377.1 3-phenylpropionate/cinnamic acid dioxygenase small subunit [Sphingobium jiangsuense]GLS99081.1 hypothetical protein GCM10007897_04590 [Sphingobium jiangsuense]
MDTRTNDALRLQWSIEQFLYEETGLLEERRFAEWLALTTDDIVYAMPVRTTRTLRDFDKRFLPIERAGHFREDKQTLSIRVKKLADPKSWSENPPSVPRIFVTNVRVRETEIDDEFLVISSFMFTRTRMEQSYAPITGRREDILRRAETPYGFMLARRMIYIDHAALPGSGINTLI